MTNAESEKEAKTEISISNIWRKRSKTERDKNTGDTAAKKKSNSAETENQAKENRKTSEWNCGTVATSVEPEKLFFKLFWD